MATRTMNKVYLLGNLTRDPDLRYTSQGTPLCTFRIATNREWSPSGTEEVREATEFHDIVAWGKLGELCDQLLFKGRKVLIEGRLHNRTWEDDDTGQRTTQTEIVCQEMIALEVPGDSGEREDRKEQNQPSAGEAGSQEDTSYDQDQEEYESEQSRMLEKEKEY